MPRIKGIPGPYRVFFTSFDCNEPSTRARRTRGQHLQFWLEPIEVARSHGFSARELNVVRRLINTYRSAILEAWHEHCG